MPWHHCWSDSQERILSPQVVVVPTHVVGSVLNFLHLDMVEKLPNIFVGACVFKELLPTVRSKTQSRGQAQPHPRFESTQTNAEGDCSYSNTALWVTVIIIEFK